MKNNELDVSRLNEGMVIKNYKEMCQLLGQNITTGNAKKAQLVEWQRYFDYEKSGQKFLITNVKEVPDRPNEHRVRRGLYVGYIEYLLTKYLANREGYVVTMTKRELYVLLGMTSEKLFDHSIKANYISNQDRTTTYEVLEFYNRAEAKLNSIITAALNSMQSRSLIKYSKEYVATTNVYNKDDMLVKDTMDITDRFTISQILELENQALRELGLNSQYEAIFKNRMSDFYRRVDELVKEKFGWVCVRSHLQIIYTIDQIQKWLPIQDQEVQRLSTAYQMLNLNKKIISYVNNQAQDRYNRQCQMTDEEWGEANPMRFSKEPLVSDKYVDIQLQLSEELMKISMAEAKAKARIIER